MFCQERNILSNIYTPYIEIRLISDTSRARLRILNKALIYDHVRAFSSLHLWAKPEIQKHITKSENQS